MKEKTKTNQCFGFNERAWVLDMKNVTEEGNDEIGGYISVGLGSFEQYDGVPMSFCETSRV